MADLQTSFSQALEDLRRDTEWSRQDALVNFQFALQDIQAQYNQSLNEAAINYENQINDINRNAAWQLSETFINNEQNKQIMELQFQQLLSSINWDNNLFTSSGEITFFLSSGKISLIKNLKVSIAMSTDNICFSCVVYLKSD